MAQIYIRVDEEKMEKIGRPIIEMINQRQQEGFTIDEVLTVLMVMTGTVIKQRGATLLIDAPLKDALPPIVHGYELDAPIPVPMKRT